jgi:hypothetical protein
MTAQGTLAIRLQISGLGALQQYSECRTGALVLQECVSSNRTTTSSSEEPIPLLNDRSSLLEPELWSSAGISRSHFMYVLALRTTSAAIPISKRCE